MMRYSAIDGLGNLGNASESVVQALSNLLQDSDSYICSFASQALEKLHNNSELEK